MCKANIAVTACSACLLELARIIDLEIDTDDTKDPSCKRVPNYFGSCNTRLTDDDDLDGVAVFLILSVAEEVCAIICGSLPVVIPQLLREYRRERSSRKTSSSYSTKLGSVPQSRGIVRGFQKLGEGPYESQNLGGEHTDWAIPLNTVVTETPPQTEDPCDAQIVVRREFEVTVGGLETHSV